MVLRLLDIRYSPALTSMREIHQFVHTLSYGDAISGEVLALRRVFLESGAKSEIFALHTHPQYKGETRRLEEFPQKFSGDVVLHYSLGSPLNATFASLTNATRSIIYHNLTPAHWFESVNARVAADISEGIAELPQLLRVSNRIIADSSYNAGELQQFGFKSVVLPLPIDPSKWNEPANEGIASILTNDPKLHFLHVGRLAPNKCIEDIIKAFYFLHYHIEEKSKLWLVGVDHDTELYAFGLKRLVQELHLSEHVEFLGRRSDGEVRALYENASVYLCASEHEGFCLPLIEAMHFGLPVIAYAGTAVPETMGNAGVLVSDKSPARFAELAMMVATDKDLRSSIIKAQHVRVGSFSFDTFAQQTRALFGLP